MPGIVLPGAASMFSQINHEALMPLTLHEAASDDIHAELDNGLDGPDSFVIPILDAMRSTITSIRYPDDWDGMRPALYAPFDTAEIGIHNTLDAVNDDFHDVLQPCWILLNEVSRVLMNYGRS